jgi:predicted nucleic acid-binding protein
MKHKFILSFENKKDKLSYTDCLGYALAMELEIPFLTGDRKFKGKKNVLWVA